LGCLCFFSSLNARFVAIVGSELESGDPLKELAPAIKLLGPILDQFVIVTDSFEPLDDGKQTGVFISKVFFQMHFNQTNKLFCFTNIFFLPDLRFNESLFFCNSRLFADLRARNWFSCRSGQTSPRPRRRRIQLQQLKQI
jgi:hypothetical protein